MQPLSDRSAPASLQQLVVNGDQLHWYLGEVLDHPDSLDAVSDALEQAEKIVTELEGRIKDIVAHQDGC